ncbi:MAG: glycosyltransferase [Rhizonema sp. PD37]|nr:glycosyltransferase [Rhizonema sp. PD37]
MLKSKPLVSIITPFFNAEKYFQEAIDSVITQKYENWELLLIDDGSTDRSSAIAQQYAAQYPKKIRCLQHGERQNRGKSISRNLGIGNAKGEYIAFLDADDVYLPQKLEKQVAILESLPETGMVYGPTLHWYSWTDRSEDVQRDFLRRVGVRSNSLYYPPSLVTQYLQDSGIVPCTCGLLVRRNVIEAIGGFEETIQNLFEDQILLAKICLQVPVFVESGSWDKYRQHPESSCYQAIKTGEYHPSDPNPARQTYLNWLETYIYAREFQDTELSSSLQKAQYPYRYPLLSQMKSKLKPILKSIAQKTLPTSVQRFLGKQLLGNNYTFPVGTVDLGNLRRVIPMSKIFGYDRGLPVDRYYIEKFLANCQDDIRGRVLEIGDDTYTRQFSGDRIVHSEVLHVTKDNPKATIVGDLTNADHIPSNSFDCFILTQTLQYIYDLRTAINTIYRILKPGGVVLVTVPGMNNTGYDQWADDWCWSFTALSLRRLFEEAFPTENLQIEAYGNVLVAAAFLYGLATEELRQEELDYQDRSYQVNIAIRAVKPTTKELS